MSYCNFTDFPIAYASDMSIKLMKAQVLAAEGCNNSKVPPSSEKRQSIMIKSMLSQQGWKEYRKTL